MCAGGGKSKTTVVVPPKTSEELAVIQKQNELLELQIQDLRRQNDVLAETLPLQKELFKAQTEVALEQVNLFKKTVGLLEETPAQKEIRELSETQAIARLKGEAPALLPGQEKLIEETFGAERTKGQREISRFLEEQASARNLRVTDSPIAAEGARAARELEEGLAGATARAKLDIGARERFATEAIRQFQEGLRQTAFQNRLALIGRPQGTGLPVFGSANAAQAMAGGLGFLNALQADRLAQTTTTTRANKPFFDLTLSSLFSGASQGVGAYAGAAAAAGSSAKLKKSILPLDQDEYDLALAKVRDTPIVRYRYKWEGEEGRAPHIGPILELSPEEIREDDTRVNVLDYAGLLHAGLKAVDRKVEHVSRLIAESVRDAGDRPRRRAAA